MANQISSGQGVSQIDAPQYNTNLETVWAKQHQSEQTLSQHLVPTPTQIVETIHVHPFVVPAAPLAPGGSTEKVSVLPGQMLLTADQFTAPGYLHRMQQAQLQQIQQELHQQKLQLELQKRQQLQELTEVGENFTQPIHSWHLKSSVPDGPVNLTQPSEVQANGGLQLISNIVTKPEPQLSIDNENSNDITFTKSEFGDNNSSREEFGELEKPLAFLTPAEESRNDSPPDPKILQQEQKEQLQNLRLGLDQEGRDKTLADTAQKVIAEMLAKEKENDGETDTPQVDENAAPTSTYKPAKKSGSSYDRSHMLSLLNEALIEFCHNNFFFAEFVHVTGRVSFNLDNRETMHLVVSQMATPQAFTEQSPKTPKPSKKKKVPTATLR